MARITQFGDISAAAILAAGAAVDLRVVHKAGVETVTGAKTFTAGVTTFLSIRAISLNLGLGAVNAGSVALGTAGIFAGGEIDLTGARALTVIVKGLVRGDARDRLEVRADGAVLWGDGSAALVTGLRRSTTRPLRRVLEVPNGLRVAGIAGFTALQVAGTLATSVADFTTSLGVLVLLVLRTGKLLLRGAFPTLEAAAGALAFLLKTGGATRITIGALGGIGLFGGAAVAQPARAGQLTDNSGGAGGGSTIARIDAPAVLTSAALLSATRNAVATLSARLNLVEQKISGAGGGIGVTA